MADLLLASQNPGKLAEMRKLVAGLPFQVVGPRDLGIAEAPEETGRTFLENAILKARYYARRSGHLTVADDSGICVDALDGGPGLHSARFGGEEASELALDSPFDFRSAALVAVPADVPEPGQSGYAAALARVVLATAEALGGRTLVLFTSYASLNTAYHALRLPLARRGITLLGQGLDGDRSPLMARFRAPDRPLVLFGTRSFWEGFDVPGAALSGLVITRLPFDVPSDPVFAARSETFENPFMDYAVPQAVLRFRQGFGRLIRRKTDRGVLLVLDRRIRGRKYGDAFLRSLPRCTLRELAGREVPGAIEAWLG